MLHVIEGGVNVAHAKNDSGDAGVNRWLPRLKPQRLAKVLEGLLQVMERSVSCASPKWALATLGEIRTTSA